MDHLLVSTLALLVVDHGVVKLWFARKHIFRLLRVQRHHHFRGLGLEQENGKLYHCPK